MATFGAFAAKAQFSALLDRAAAGEEIVVTKHGRPVAKIVAATAGENVDVAALLKRMKDGRTASLGGLDWKALRDEGRP
ncbi:MAG: type II toxin-antitoxin system Phd/YefM family antitoxin [Devosia sp.]|jgi:prevent-host-death family protein|nr:type II toxin-antitoxin system prevent-host-death family antitoxin [Devosia sp.]